MNKNVVFVIFFLTSIVSSGQTGDQYFADQLKRFFNLYPQENAFLLIDNTTYLKGERIWYKVFLWNAKDDHLSDDVRVLLRDVNGQVLSEQRMLIANGEGQGDFEISDRIPNDVYFIELYSNWMQNFTHQPIAKRVVSISDGNPSLENLTLANNSRKMGIRGNFVPGQYSRFDVFTGFFAPRKFQLEVLCNNQAVFTKRYESTLVSDSILIEKEGDYQFRVCMEEGNDCFSEIHTTKDANVFFNQPHKLNFSGQSADYLLAVCTANSFLETKRIEGGTSLGMNLSNYPAGLIYFLLIDKNAKRIVSTTAAYNRPVDQAINPKITVLGNATEQFPLTVIEMDEPFGEFHLTIQASEGTTGFQMLNDVDTESLSKALNLHSFPLMEKMNDFFEKGSLPIARKSRDFDLRVDKPSLDAIDFLLSDLGNRKKMDSVARYKKMIDGIQSDYSVDDELSYAQLPADVRYMPVDYPTLHEPIEFLRQAIPRLKTKTVGNSENFHFLYTNLRDQKQLYESPAALIINGHKVPSFAFLGNFGKDEIISINALYNSETLVASELTTLLPGGAIEVKLKWSSRALEKLAGLPLFSLPYSWTHDLQAPAESQGRTSPRFPLFATLYRWSEPYENEKSVSIRLPRRHIQSTSVSYFSMKSVKGGTYKKIPLKID